MDLQTAKQLRLVGETPSGYLQTVQAGNVAADRLVLNVNATRKKQYLKIAKRRNISLLAVEQLAGKKAIAKTPAGQFIKVNGKWVIK
ncbi:MAG: hypothetical protein CSA33_00225 [Desulfobulbus propionicus]|nr:MAG: hypothetical protein CSA33_00225 [Desulfobulbus propionicus]